MKKNKKTISASEINRFVYCNYQWYYGKIYGSTRLRELVNERNKKLKSKDEALSNFKKGLDYHSNYHDKYILKQRIYKITMVLIFIFILVLVITFRNELGFLWKKITKF